MDKIDYSKDYVCGYTGLPCIACNPGACEHRRKTTRDSSSITTEKTTKIKFQMAWYYECPTCNKIIHTCDNKTAPNYCPYCGQKVHYDTMYKRNYDKIRLMDIEKMAKWLSCVADCSVCAGEGCAKCDFDCDGGIKKWLEQEVEE